jgi:predicted ATP-binding protein involved in virulence
MKITHLDLLNFKGFKKAEFEFDGHFNLIVGENGSGKSSLLDALAVAAGSFLLGVRGYDSRHIREEEVRAESSSQGERPIPLRQYPVEVKAKGIVFDPDTLTGEWPLEWKREISGEKGETKYLGAKALKQRAEKLIQSVQADKVVSLPVIAHYGAGRLWVPTRDLQGENIKPSALKNPARLDAYTFCIDPRIKFVEIFNWLANEKYTALEQGYENEIFKVAKNAMSRCVKGCSFLDYSVKEKDLFVAFDGKDRLPFSMLSDGQRAMLSMVADIAIKAAILNPHHKEVVLWETSGVVLIDEIDLHLHPKWQRQVVANLKEIFPKIQFFASTHSPQVIGETPIDQIIVLRQDGSWFKPKASLGLNSNEVLRDIMDANYVSSAFIRQIEKLDGLLASGEFEDAQKLISELRVEFPNVPEFDRVDAYMTQMDELAEEES